MGKVLDVIQGSQLKAVRDEVEIFVEGIMRDYLAKCQNSSRYQILSQLSRGRR